MGSFVWVVLDYLFEFVSRLWMGCGECVMRRVWLQCDFVSVLLRSIRAGDGGRMCDRVVCWACVWSVLLSGVLRADERARVLCSACGWVSGEWLRLKLTWRRDQGDQECPGPRWRLALALRRVEACDDP